ncbi:DUF1045 domain-containing protein [Chthonobacter rhizosphaerae]|uniref:DUF1045 domain-containing protein n=1 Tax=Chthonobacter rhizosphaerae TaxID=2735553 RepID=UPI0015EF798D|nr:DUF1045 domain-containing protein [Chthonobacter rhizosphaerae]
MRYAIYFAPPPGSPLAEAGARWLGRDAFTGAALTQPAVEGVDPETVRLLTTDPRRYGFHATLKAPFGLKPGASAAALVDRFETFAAERPPFRVRLAVRRLGGFIAIIPDEPSEPLQALADDCVRAFEPFRRPLTVQEVEKRRKAGLSPREEAHLMAWGYPAVFDTFRFHMTLSQRVLGPEGDRLEEAARAYFADILAEPVTVDHLGLFAEPPGGGPFTVHVLKPLAGR